MSVVTQEVFQRDVQVVGETSEVLMPQGSIHDSDIAHTVVNGIVAEHDVVGQQANGVVSQLIDRVERFNLQSSVGHELSHEIDAVERPDETSLAIEACLHVADEAAAESFEKLGAGILGLEPQVDEIPWWRHISLDECMTSVTLVGNGVDVNLFLFLVPFHIGMQVAHASVLKSELLHL